MINIDIIEHCNFKCYFCGASKLTAKQYMDVDLFYRIVDEAVELGITSVMLTPALGEPFLHPNIYEMLDYTTSRFNLVTIVSNASAIDVPRLKQVARPTLQLQISQYGRNEQEFSTLTNMPGRLFGIFTKKLEEMTEANINFSTCMRDLDYHFNTEDDPDPPPIHDIHTKCRHHMMPKIFHNGDVTFCRFVSDGIDVVGAAAVTIANVNTTPLRDILTDPIRYKFFDSQSICALSCRLGQTQCGKATFNAYKLMAESKQNYIQNKEHTDQRYARIEHIRLQLDQP